MKLAIPYLFSKVRIVKEEGRKQLGEIGPLQFASSTHVNVKRSTAYNSNQLPSPLLAEVRIYRFTVVWSFGACEHVHLTTNTSVFECPTWFTTGMGTPQSHITSMATPHRRGLFMPTWWNAQVAGTKQCVQLRGKKSLEPKPQSQLLFSKTAIIQPLKGQRIGKCMKPHLEKSWQNGMP